MAMAFGICFSVTLLLSIFATAKCDLPDGVIHMECRDRYFMIAIDHAFSWDEYSFEAVDRTGVYPITEEYAAKCGYSISVVPLQGKIELRASYFSCHTDNKDDEVFMFSFNLLIHEGQKATYALNKTCSPSLPWSPREVTCEVNYMEVSVRSAVSCPSGTKDNWNSLKPAYESTTSDWQVMFQRAGVQLPPITLSEAHKQGYVFNLTDGRLVFRTPYGQPDSFNTTVNGVPVEVVHAALFSRQSWVVLMVDMVAACSMDEASYDDGYVVWETPAALYPSLHNADVRIGLNGELVPQSAAEDRDYVVETHNGTVQISIPYNAEGGVRESFVNGGLHEYYSFEFYFEQLLVDEDYVETRFRLQRTLATPLLPRPVFTENRTVVEDRVFTIYLGDVPEDVELAALQLNGHECTLPFPNTSIHTISEVVEPNNTRGYILSVPFDDPVVVQQFSKEDAAMTHKLAINYTLTVQPENASFYHFTSVMALTDVSPPTFEAVCLESGISFRLDHQPSDYLWEIRIGSEPLTSDLAAQRGYIMSNDSQSLLLEVPLFTEGYEYKDFTLNGFIGTFEILVLDHATSQVQNSAIKTCQFKTTELIVCSKDGRMTVVIDLSLAASEGIPARTNLVNPYCGPNDVDGTKALFTFPLNSCGSTVRLRMGNVTYENEIIVSKRSLGPYKGKSDFIMQKVTVQCTYPLVSLYRLFSVYKFESDTPGVGRIIHNAEPTEEPITPTAATTTTPVTKGRDLSQFKLQPALHPPARYIKIKNFPRRKQKYAGGSSLFNVKI